MKTRLNKTHLSIAVLMISSSLALSGCAQLIEKLRGGDAGSDAAAADDSGAVAADDSDAAAETGDAAAEAGATTAVTFHAGDQIPTFNGDNAAATREINSQNYKTQLVTLDQQVKALK